MARLRRSGGPKYDLRDTFDDTRAAGAVNGTLATDCKNTRTVTDPTSRLSISNGRLIASGGVGSQDDIPLIIWNGQARTAGRLLIAETTPLTSRGPDHIGWYNDVPLRYDATVRFLINNIYLQEYVAANIGVIIGTYTNAVTYIVAVCLRAAGSFVLVKGGTYTTWTLLYEVANAATATVYPGLGYYASANTSRVNHVLVPSPRWLPTPLLSDGFGGTFGTSDGLGHPEGVTGGLGSGGGGVTWTAQIGTWANAAGVCGATALAGGIAIATAETTKADVIHTVECTRSAGNVGTVVRYADADNYVYAIHNGTNALLIKRVATAETTLINAAATYAAGAELRIICNGTSFALFYADKNVGTPQTISDAALQAGTAHGLYTSDTGNTFDDAVTHKWDGHDVPA